MNTCQTSGCPQSRGCDRARCQNEDLLDASTHLTQILAQAGVVVNNLRRQGAAATLRKIVAAVIRKPVLRLIANRKARSAVPATGRPPESTLGVLDLQPGDLVEVRPREEILRTLDASGRLRGLVVMPEMLEHCGRRFRVHKRVQRMLLEGTGEMRNVKHTVLLEDSMCSGQPIGCDRMCFFFWRETWLKRIPE